MVKKCAILLLLFWLCGCGGGSGNAGPGTTTRKGTMRLAVVWPQKSRDTILEHSESLQLEITASDGEAETVLLDRPAQNEPQTETVVRMLPDGGSTVNVTAWELPQAQGRELGHGTQDFEIVAGQTVSVSVQLESSTGGVTVAILNGDVTQIAVQPAFRVDPKKDRYSRGTPITLVGRIAEMNAQTPVVNERLEFWMKSDRYPQGRRITIANTDAAGRALYSWTVPTDPAEDNIYLWIKFERTWLFGPAATSFERLPIG
jgi:hypothetical protein